MNHDSPWQLTPARPKKCPRAWVCHTNRHWPPCSHSSAWSPQPPWPNVPPPPLCYGSWNSSWQVTLPGIPSRSLQYVWICMVWPASSPIIRANSPPGGDWLTASPSFHLIVQDMWLQMTRPKSWSPNCAQLVYVWTWSLLWTICDKHRSSQQIAARIQMMGGHSSWSPLFLQPHCRCQRENWSHPGGQGNPQKHFLVPT